MAPLPPVFYHYFCTPLPYTRTLLLQEKIHQLQLAARRSSSHHDILLLLEHRPVYTSGRRQTEQELHAERARLTSIGAEFAVAARGGQLTYHGPGQLVGYPLLDLARTSPPIGIRDYICIMQKMIQSYLLRTHGITHVPSDHTGVFLDAVTKIASIGVQPLEWFGQVVACGLADVKAGCITEAKGKNVRVEDVVPGIVDAFGTLYGRDMVKLYPQNAGELGEAILALEEDALAAGEWLRAPSPN
ncbi:lipoyltransferase, partial [Suillus cothurnatus]